MATVALPATRAGHPTRTALELGALVALGALAVTAVAVHAGDPPLRAPDALSLTRAAALAGYLVAGVYTRWRRPSARFGLYLIGFALAYSVGTLASSQDELAHTIGRVAFAGVIVLLVYIVICFPHDGPRTPGERELVRSFAVTSAALWLITVPLVEELPAAGPLTDCSGTCPDNAFRLVTVPHGLSSLLDAVVTAATAAGLLALAFALFQKARAPARLRQRLIVPLLGCAIVMGLNYALYSVLREAGVEQLGGLKLIGGAAALSIPVAMLVGQVRGHVFAATSLGELVARVGSGSVTPARVETLLRDALGDSLLKLALWDPGRRSYVDVRGDELELPSDRRDVTVTPVPRDGRPFAAVIHDPVVDESSDIARGLAATALMLLENAQLVEELRASRARVAASEQRERLRLERDLHDGAQQRLFAIQIKLEAARDRAGDDGVGSELDEIAADAAAAVQDLRALAHGIYPTVLRERGLADGIRSLARSAPVPVEVVDRGVGRCASTVEEAVYFCVSEAIQNATKHAGRGARVTVTLARRGDTLDFAVADDGAGLDGAADPDGIGLVSMRDRIGAVGGELHVESRAGEGTTVRGAVPVDGVEFIPSG